MRPLAILAAIVAALLAGAAVRALRQWRNAVLFRHGQVGYKDVAVPREAMVACALLGSALGVLGPTLLSATILACLPALALVVASAIATRRQSRLHLP